MQQQTPTTNDKPKSYFTGTSPCNNCPYRKDAPLQHWDIAEFKQVIVEDQLQFGKVFSCHKKDSTVCRGYLMNQDRRGFPNINLRMMLTKNNVTREYLDKLKCDSPLYKSIKAMAKANYPNIKL